MVKENSDKDSENNSSKKSSKNEDITEINQTDFSFSEFKEKTNLKDSFLNESILNAEKKSWRDLPLSDVLDQKRKFATDQYKDNVLYDPFYLKGSAFKDYNSLNFFGENEVKIHGKENDEPDEISQLSEEDKENLDDILEYYSDVSLSYDTLYSLFQEWQSSKTKGSKKFYFTVTFLLSFGFFTGVDLSDLRFFGTDISDLNPIALILTLLFVLCFSGLHYYLHYRRDKQVNEARLLTIKGELNECLLYKSKLEEMAIKADGTDVENLMAKRLTTEKLLGNDSPLNVYHSINHYDEELKKPDSSSQMLSKFESIGLSFLFITSITFIAENLLLNFDFTIDIELLFFPIFYLLVAVFYQIYKS